MLILQVMWMVESPQVHMCLSYLGSWRSKKQEVVAQSTTEAEYIATAEACKEAVWLKLLCSDIGVQQGPIPLWCDNKSAIDLAVDPKFHSRTKHIRVRFHFIREVVEEGGVNLQKVKTDVDTVDALTEAVSTRSKIQDSYSAESISSRFGRSS